MMTSCEPSPSGTPSVCISDVTLSTMMTEGEIDNDTVTSLDQFPGEYTPAQWTNSKKLKTPTPSFPRTFDSNMSSVTCMKYAILQDSSQREIVTPLRDLMPLEQEVPYEPCQLPMNELGSANKENDSPTTVNVISPATAFRMKKAVFETKAQAYKSPNRKQRARHVSLFDNSPNQQPTEHLSTSPNSAIVTETGDDSQIVTATATAEIVPTVLETKPLTHNSKQTDEMIELNIEGDGAASKDETEKEQEMEQQQGVLIAKETAIFDVVQTESEPVIAPVHDSATVSAETAPTTSSAVTGFSMWKFGGLIMALLAVVLFTSRAYTSSHHQGVVNAPVLVPSVVSYSDLEVFEEPVEMATQVYEPTVMMDSANQVADIQEDAVASIESDMQLAIGTTAEPSFLRDVEELGTALSVLLRHHLHNAVSSYETHHGPAVRAALSGLRTKMQPLTAAVTASVAEFHHRVDTSELKHEWLRVTQRVSAQVRRHTSELKNAFADGKQQLYYKAPLLPVAEEVLGRGLVNLKVGVTATLRTMHRFVKENELLCEEYSF